MHIGARTIVCCCYALLSIWLPELKASATATTARPRNTNSPHTLYPRWIIVIRVVSRCGCLTMSLPHQVCWNCWYADSLTFIISQPAGDYLHVPWLGQPTSMHHCTSMLSP
jgi:hypothetical protein